MSFRRMKFKMHKNRFVLLENSWISWIYSIVHSLFFYSENVLPVYTFQKYFKFWFVCYTETPFFTVIIIYVLKVHIKKVSEQLVLSSHIHGFLMHYQHRFFYSMLKSPLSLKGRHYLTTEVIPSYPRKVSIRYSTYLKNT